MIESVMSMISFHHFTGSDRNITCARMLLPVPVPPKTATRSLSLICGSAGSGEELTVDVSCCFVIAIGIAFLHHTEHFHTTSEKYGYLIFGEFGSIKRRGEDARLR